MIKNKKDDISENSEIIDRYVTELKKKEKSSKRKFKFKKKRMYKRKKPIIVCAVLTLAIILGFGLAFAAECFKIYDFGFLPEKQISVEVIPNSTGKTPIEYVAPNRPSKIFGTTVFINEDISLSSSDTEIEKLFENIKSKSLTTVFISLNKTENELSENETARLKLENIIGIANKKGLTAFVQVDLRYISSVDCANSDAVKDISEKFTLLSKINGIGGIVISGVERNTGGEDFENYLTLGSFSGYKVYSEGVLTNLVKNINYAVKKANPTLYLCILCDNVYKSDKTDPNGLKTNSETELLRDKNADVMLWLKEKYFDAAFVNVPESTTDKTPSFEDVVKWWSSNTEDKSDIGFILSSDKAAKGEGSYKNPDQLTRQLMYLNNSNRYTFAFNSYSSMENDKSEASSVAYKYIGGDVSNDYILSNLTITAPTKTDVTVYDNTVSFVGASDPNFSITLNGKELERTEYGYFSVTEELKVGNNTFTFEHKGSKKTYNVFYKFVVLKSYSPAKDTALESGSTLIIKSVARKNAVVTAKLNGKTYTLSKSSETADSDFATFTGAVVLGTYSQNTSLGKIVFTAVSNGVTDSYKGGNITVNKKPEPVSSIISSIINNPLESITSSNQNSNTPSMPPKNNYIGVGNKLIAEVIKYQIETFNGNTYDDLSQPYNNYLPKGTVDYCSDYTIYDPDSGGVYRALRCGKRVYAKESKGNIRTLRGTLPSYNILNASSVTTNGQYTVLTLDTYWKAPFNLQLLPQKYYGGVSDQRGKISSRTFSYIDITFCYATQFGGNYKSLEESPLFKKAELIKGASDYTLRLHLEKVGTFYGWTANYDQNGNLVFKFLNPVKAQPANNAYGGTLKGITIAVDAGHGGKDSGALGANPYYSESNRNLLLAKKLEQKLTALGAKVVMTRTTETALDQDTRITAIKNANANLAISVHRNSALNASARGFGSYYFNPYTHQPAEYIYKYVTAGKHYSKTNLLWHYFYLSRISDCPVVLTENGFMSNAADYNNMMSDAYNDKCADSIVKGIVAYFLNIG